MIRALITQLEDVLPELPKCLTQYQVNQEGYFLQDFPFISRHDANAIFLCIFSGLNKLVATDSAVSGYKIAEILESEIASLKDIAHTQILHGASFKELLGSIKLIRKVFEERINGLPATEKNILHLQSKFCFLIDVYELEIASWWETLEIAKIEAGSVQANRILTTEKAIYKSIFDTTSNLVLVTDGAGYIIEVNPEAKIFFSGETVKGQFFGDLLKLPFSNIEQLLQHTQIESSREISISSADVTRAFNLQIRPLSQLYPLTEGVLLILNDITYAVDHRQALENRVIERTRDLTKSEKILDTIFQSVGKGILLIDSDLEIFKANEMASEIYGIPQEVLVGTSYRLLTDDKGMELMSEVCATLGDGEIRNIECLGTYVDGRQFPSMLTIASMTLEGQHFWPIIVWDISEEKKLETKLLNQKLQAEEMNVTLRNVLGTIESQRKEFEQNISRKIQTSILPAIEKVKAEENINVRSSYLLLLKEQLIDITAGFDNALDGDLLKLSKTELQICKYIRVGLTGNEICDAMNLAFETIQTHRKNIRKKLGLRGRNVNLYTFLVERNFG
jgi:PAS domain S-box-containing protein